MRPRKILALATWFFVAALFADAANVTDLFLGVDTLHDDADVGYSGTSMDFSLTQLPVTAQHPPSIPHSPKKNPASKTSAPKLTIFDQDSPCVAAVPFSAAVPTSLYPDENTRAYTNPITGETLYLKLCTLLI